MSNTLLFALAAIFFYTGLACYILGTGTTAPLLLNFYGAIMLIISMVMTFYK